MKKGWRTFGGITLVYGIGVLIFVRSFSVSVDTSSTAIADASGITGKLGAGISQLGTFFQSSATSLSAASGVYQILISTICCLAILWAAREFLSGNKPKLKASFYESTQPFVPYLLVTVMLGVYLIPIALGGYLYGLVLSLGILSGFPAFVAFLLFAVLAAWSVGLLVHGMFALLIVTLPETKPVAAIKNAKKLVLRRRLLIIRKFLLALLFIGIVCAVVMLPFIIWLPGAASWIFYLLSICFFTYGELYIYVLYRELL
mgnify:CR=1 FL=1